MALTKPAINATGWGITLNNALDYLENRGNLVGSQPASTISDFSTAVQSVVNGMSSGGVPNHASTHYPTGTDPLDPALLGVATPDDVNAMAVVESAYTDQQISTLELKVAQMLGRPTSASNLQVTDRSATTITLTWAASIPPPGGSTTNYRVFVNNTVVAASVGTTGLTYTVTGLTANTSYEIYVVSSNSNGDGPQSNTATGVTLPAGPTVPAAPAGLAPTFWNDSEVDLSWAAVTSPSGPLTGYKIFRAPAASGAGTYVQLNGSPITATTYVDTTVAANTAYDYVVKAYNASGDSAASDYASVRTPASLAVPGVRGTFGWVTNGTTTPPYTTTLPTGIQNGDVGYLSVEAMDGTTTPTAPTSPSGTWNLVDGPRANGTTQRAWLYRNDAMTTADAGATVSIPSNQGGNRPGFIGIVLSGAQAAWDAEVQWLDGTADTSLDIPAITPTVRNTRLVLISVGRYTTTAGTNPGYTLPSPWVSHLQLRSTHGTAPQSAACVASQPLGAPGVVHAAESDTFTDNASEFGWLITVAPAPLKLSAPQNLVVTQKDSTSVTWTWGAPAQVPSGDPVTNYKIYNKSGVQIDLVPATQTTYQRTGLTPASVVGLAVTAVCATAGEGPATPTLTVTTDPATVTLRFAGDPGVNKMYIGATHNNYTNDQFDKRVFPGTTANDPPTKRTKLDRIYNTKNMFLLDTGMKNKLRSNAAAGIISVLSWKGIKDSGNTGAYFCSDIVAGAADADITANATFLRDLGYPVWWAFFHEPENLGLNASNPLTTLNNYRAAYRYQINMIRGIAPNVAFCSPFFTNFDWVNGNHNTLHDMRWYHPNYTGDPTTQGTAGGGQWLTNGPFTVGSVTGTWVHMDGIDFYDPDLGNKIALDRTKRNQLFMNQFQIYLNRRTTDGAYNLPTVVGEGGFYNNVDWLTSSGTTNADQFNDMFTNGATNGLVGCVFWNSGEALFDDTKDLYPTVGSRTAALRTSVNANLSSGGGSVIMG